MAISNSPGCMLRGALVTFGLMFLPMAIVFIHRDVHKYWPQSIVLAVFSFLFLRAGLTRDEDSWIAMVDELRSRDDK